MDEEAEVKTLLNELDAVLIADDMKGDDGVVVVVVVGGGGGGGYGGSHRPRDSFDANALQAPDANDFTNARIVEELELRKVRPTGFRDQDIASLQMILNEEFEQEKENLIRLQREKKEVALKQAGLQKKRALLETQLKEEKEAVAEDHRIAAWLELVKQNATPATARIEVNSITARALSKTMWTNTSLTSLDLSRNGLDDFAGAYIARLLRRNTALIKLEVDSNMLGPRSCMALGECLKVNKTLRHLNLESNPLTLRGGGIWARSSSAASLFKTASGGGGGGGGSVGASWGDGSNEKDYHAIMGLAEILQSNNSLTSLNLWRCGLGARGGREIAHALQQNHTITFLGIGSNGMGNEEMKMISDILTDNVERHQQQQEVLRKEKEKRDAIEAREQAIQLQLRKERELREWLDEQRMMRAESRRAEVIEEYELQVEAEELALKLKMEEAERERKAAEDAKAKKAKKKKMK